MFVVLLAVMLSVLVELVLNMPLPFGGYAGAFFAAVAGGACAVVLDPRRERLVFTLGWTGVLCLALTILYAVPWTSRKPFLRDLDRVSVGMTPLEVDKIMAPYIRGTGWPRNPFVEVRSPSSGTIDAPRGAELQIADSVVFRHSNEAAFNSDWGVVTFRNGVVSKVDFMPD